MDGDSLEGALLISEAVLKELWRIGEARPGMHAFFLDNNCAASQQGQEESIKDSR